jgi:hypothetical protein
VCGFLNHVTGLCEYCFRRLSRISLASTNLQPDGVQQQTITLLCAALHNTALKCIAGHCCCCSHAWQLHYFSKAAFPSTDLNSTNQQLRVTAFT